MAKQNLGYELNKLRAENNTLKHELRKWKEVKPGGSKMIALEEVCEAQQLELYEMKKWNETLAASLASAIEKHEASSLVSSLRISSIVVGLGGFLGRNIHLSLVFMSSINDSK